jgi:Mce-associated membrane protein
VDDVEPPADPENPEPPAAATAADEPTVAAHRRIGLVEGVGLAVIVILLVALIVTKLQLSNQDSLNADRTSAITAAENDAVDVASYSYKDLSKDFGRVKAESTPSFRATFTKSSDALSKVLTQYKATATAVVKAAGVVSVSSSKAVVILFVNQSVTNTAQKGTTTDESRVKVTLENSGGKWLLEGLTLPT